LNQAFNQSKLTFEQLSNDTNLGFVQIVKKLEAASVECSETGSQLSRPTTSHSQSNASFENIDSHLDKALKDITNKQQVNTLPSFFDEFINGIEINDNVHINQFFKYSQLDLLDSLLEGSNDTNNNSVYSVEQLDPSKQPLPHGLVIKTFDNKQKKNHLNDMMMPPPPPSPNIFDNKQKAHLSNENKDVIHSSSTPPPPIEKRTRRNSTRSQTSATMVSVVPSPPPSLTESKQVKRPASSALFDKENQIPNKKIKIEHKEEAKKAKKGKYDGPRKCGECQKTLCNAYNLSRHINAMHRQNKVVKVKDEALDVKMANVRAEEAVKPAVVESVALDNESNVFQCEICTKRFTRENTLFAHINSFHWNDNRSARSSNTKSRRDLNR